MHLPENTSPFPNDPITPSQAAKLGSVSLPTIYRRISRGQLRAWRDPIDGRLRVIRAEVQSQRSVRPTTAANPEKAKATRSAYYKANREKILARARAYKRELRAEESMRRVRNIARILGELESP